MSKKTNKIGIITIHRINNYGAILQAYALNAYLRSLGFDAETIDFRTYRVAESYKLYGSTRSVMDLVRNMQAFLFRRKLQLRISKMNEFVEKNIRLSQGTYYSNNELALADLDYGAYICGSDQIWNTYCDNYDDAFILSFAKDKGKRLSYAASMGMSSLHPNFNEKFRNELSGFAAISVREKTAVDIISSVSGQMVTHVVDPVFLLSKEQWDKVLNSNYSIKKPYIFFYAVHGELKGMRDYVKKMSVYYRLPVVVVSMNLREMLYCNMKCYDAGPAEFLSLIKDAKYVFTNSFHGCAFSIIFKKKFQVYVPYLDGEQTSSRIFSLLNSFQLADRIVNINGDVTRIDAEIHWDEVYNHLNSQIELSKNFLSNAL